MNTTTLFNESGWHLEPSLLDVALGRDFLSKRHERLAGKFGAWIGTENGSYPWHQKQLPTYESRGLPADLRHYLTGEFDLETRLDTRIAEILSTERSREFICRFFGSDRYLIHYPPMIRFKVAEAPSNLVPVHQDYAYNRHLSNFITVWVPLVDITEECGGIIGYAGSHLSEPVEHAASGAWSNKARTDLSRFSARHILMKAGDALFFPPRLLHQSAPHRSATIRYSIDFRVFRQPSDTTKSYYDPFTKTVRRQH
jgi:hypothetical protein